jgi:hypothetical protein
MIFFQKLNEIKTLIFNLLFFEINPTCNSLTTLYHYALKASRLVFQALLEGFYLLRLWTPKDSPHIEAARKFVEANNKLGWRVSHGNTKILLEGHLSDYGPNYMFRTALAAKAIEQTSGGAEIVVVVDGYSHQWRTAYECYRSFGIESWIYLGRRFILLRPFFISISLFRAFQYYFKLQKPLDILNLRFGRIKVGDLVYDQVLRNTKSPTIRNINFSVFFEIARSYFYFQEYDFLLKRSKFEYYIATHTAYPQYGLLCRLALAHDVKVLETTDIQTSLHNLFDPHNPPTYHGALHEALKQSLVENGSQTEYLLENARNDLDKRFNSELNQIDAMKAFSGKVYKRQELLEKYGVPSSNKIGFILGHIFIDSPHLSKGMLYNDYYDWLVSTINCCAKSEGIVWIVKPHPSSDLYGEQGMVEALVNGAQTSNLFICPADLNTRSLANCADVVVTVHGTAGLEFACLGIPVIVAGTPFHAGFGIHHEPKSRDQYEECLLNAALIEPLSSEQVNLALCVFAQWNKEFDWNNPIITPDLLSCVWGSSRKRDLKLAYEIMTKNLQATDPRELKLWKFASLVAKRVKQ